MEGSGQLHALVASPMGKNPSTHWTQGGLKAWWAIDPAKIIWRKEKFCTPARIHTPDHPSCSIVTVVDLFCLFFYAVVIWDYVVSNGRIGMNKEQERHGRCQSWPNVGYCPSICLRNWGVSWYNSGWFVSLLGFELSTSQIQVRSVTAWPNLVGLYCIKYLMFTVCNEIRKFLCVVNCRST